MVATGIPIAQVLEACVRERRRIVIRLRSGAEIEGVLTGIAAEYGATAVTFDGGSWIDIKHIAMVEADTPA